MMQVNEVRVKRLERTKGWSRKTKGKYNRKAWLLLLLAYQIDCLFVLVNASWEFLERWNEKKNNKWKKLRTNYTYLNRFRSEAVSIQNVCVRAVSERNKSHQTIHYGHIYFFGFVKFFLLLLYILCRSSHCCWPYLITLHIRCFSWLSSHSGVQKSLLFHPNHIHAYGVLQIHVAKMLWFS